MLVADHFAEPYVRSGELVPVLPELGYRGLSQFGPRKRVTPVQHLRQVNCHVDPIDWRGFWLRVLPPRRTPPSAWLADSAAWSSRMS